MLEDLAGELRAAFDRSFAEPPRPPGGATVDLLALRLGKDRYAIPLEQIRAVVSGKRVTPLPGSPPELLGLAGFRSELVPVYDLGLLLGYPSVSSRAPCLVLTRQTPRFGLAFGELEAYVRVPTEHVVEQPGVGTVLTPEYGGRPILQLASVRAKITEWVRPGGPKEEQA